MTTIDKKVHAFKRRVTVQALTPQSVKGLEELILHNVRDFCRLLVEGGQIDAAGWSSGRDMSKMTSYALSDIMGDVTFSKNWNTQKGTENRHILKLLPQGTCGINMVSHPITSVMRFGQGLFNAS